MTTIIIVIFALSNSDSCCFDNQNSWNFLKTFFLLEKRDRSERELGLITDHYQNEANQIVEDILAQLQSKKQSQTMIALVSLTQYVKKEPRNGKF